MGEAMNVNFICTIMHLYTVFLLIDALEDDDDDDDDDDVANDDLAYLWKVRYTYPNDAGQY